jgi:Flp pilus assembly pilin Flp
LCRLWKDEAAVTMTEYAVIFATIGLGAMVGLIAIAVNANHQLGVATTNMQQYQVGPPPP